MTTVAEASRKEPVLQRLQGFQKEINRREQAIMLQKRCAACNHPFSFHGSGRTAEMACRAMGCKCEAWSEGDPWVSQEHYGAVVSILRAMEVSARLVVQGEKPLLYVGGYYEPPEVDLAENTETPALPGVWQPPFAVWANHDGAWGYSVIEEDGQVTGTATEVMPHDTEASDVARIVATWSFPPEA